MWIAGNHMGGEARRIHRAMAGYTLLMANSDQVKGKIKQAVGDLTGNQDMRSDGQIDEAAGNVKEKASNAVDAVKDILHTD